MTEFSFADAYKSVGISISMEQIDRRKTAFDQLRPTVDRAKAADLARLYFGLPFAIAPQWFRDGFAANDTSFSLIDNEREASVLAGCLIAGNLDDGKPDAALALLCARAGGVREPRARPELLNDAARLLQRLSLARRAESALPKASRAPSDEVTAKINKYAESGAHADGAEAMKAIATEKNAEAADLKDFQQAVRALREEVDMLWWLAGAHSRALDRPFATLPPALAALMAGADLGQLTQISPGPIAAPALLYRALGDRAAADVTIEDAVNALPEGALDRLALPDAEQYADICPALGAVTFVQKLGTDGWLNRYEAKAQFDAKATLVGAELALQVYRELLFCSTP